MRIPDLISGLLLLSNEPLISIITTAHCNAVWPRVPFSLYLSYQHRIQHKLLIVSWMTTSAVASAGTQFICVSIYESTYLHMYVCVHLCIYFIFIYFRMVHFVHATSCGWLSLRLADRAKRGIRYRFRWNLQCSKAFCSCISLHPRLCPTAATSSVLNGSHLPLLSLNWLFIILNHCFILSFVFSW